MKRFYLLLLTIVLICTSASGQNTTRSVRGSNSASSAYAKDTTSLLFKYYFGGRDTLYNDTIPVKYTAHNPKYYKLFVPLTFYYSPVNQITENLYRFPSQDSIPKGIVELLPVDSVRYNKYKQTNKQVNNILLDTYQKYPKLVIYTEEEIKSRKTFRKDVEVKISPKATILELFQPDKVYEEVGEAKIVIQKPNFWIKGGNGSLQFSQNYISDNWYKGGESANTLSGNIQLTANYNDKEKVQFENILEYRVGFSTVPSDTIREYRINADVFRFYSKLGIQAASKWYYTISGEFNTQFFNNYKANSNDVVSAFMAPANLILSIGMDYKLNKKKLNLSVFISPLAYNLRYVGNSRVNEVNFGLDEGKDFLHDFGSKLETTSKWQIIPSIVWDSRLYYFSNYDKVQAEWENTLNFVLNRYLSTKLFVHTRFDDGVKRIEGKSYFQVIELLSFGINYKW